MRVRAILLAAVLILAPLAARAADLVVWWEEGYNPEEDQAAREVVTAFEHKTGERVEFVQYSQDDMPTRTLAAIEASRPPDFLFATTMDPYYGQWAHEDRLVDLT